MFASVRLLCFVAFVANLRQRAFNLNVFDGNGVIVELEPASASPADPLLPPCSTAGSEGFSCSVGTDFVVLAEACGCASSFGFTRLWRCVCRVRWPLTKASVTYHRF